MQTIEDLTGRVFGALRVLRRSQRAESNRSSAWLCRCICGRQRIVRRDKLTSGKTASCGHHCHENDLTGKKFGHLTVTARAGLEEQTLKEAVKWTCICDCGNQCGVRSWFLTSGQTRSCGCLKRTAQEGRIIPITEGTQFGWLTVDGVAPRENGRAMLRVSCARCGGGAVVRRGNLRRGKSVSCGCYLRDPARIVRDFHYPHSTVQQIRDYLTMKHATRKVEKCLTQTK